jgi:purine-binding chemotaxis protein CheW
VTALDERTPAVQAVLARRAARLRERPPARGDDAVAWIAEFPIGDKQYALPLEVLRATLPLRMVTPVPLAPPYVIGVVRFQGQILTAISLSSLLGIRGWRHDPPVLVVVDTGFGHLTAIDCEEVPKAISLPFRILDEVRARGVKEMAIELIAEQRTIHFVDPARVLDRRERTRDGG